MWILKIVGSWNQKDMNLILTSIFDTCNYLSMCDVILQEINQLLYLLIAKKTLLQLQF